MKILSINSIVIKYLGIFCEGLKLIADGFRPLVNQFNYTFAYTNSFPISFLSTKGIWESGKRGLINYLSAWGSDWRLCLKLLPSRKKRDIFMKNGNERRDVLGDSRKRYRCRWAEIGNYGPRKEKKKLTSLLNKRHWWTKREFRLIVSWEAIHIIGRSLLFGPISHFWVLNCFVNK